MDKRSKEQLQMSHVDYDSAPKGSLWGKGDKIVLGVFAQRAPSGTWADIGAGDGRYVYHLLRTCDSVVAFDNDQRALDKLVRDLSDANRLKVKDVLGDLNQALPFQDSELDGLLCAATLHIFKPEIIRRIGAEFQRVVKPGGSIVVDMLGDIRRVQSNGELYRYPGETSYSSSECEELLRAICPNSNVTITKAQIANQKRSIGVTDYELNATQVLADIVK